MQSGKPKFLALGTCRMVGKDTFFSLLNEIDPRFKRMALADELKSKMSRFCYSVFGKTPERLTPEEKEMFRPLLIEAGRVARSVDVDFWCKQLMEQIVINKIANEYQDSVYTLTDCRYPNEYQYFKKIYGDSMLFVNIERIGAPEPTEEEKVNSPELIKMADANIRWGTDPSLESLRPIVRKFYNQYFAA
jgi:hypothetical protein